MQVSATIQISDSIILEAISFAGCNGKSSHSLCSTISEYNRIDGKVVNSLVVGRSVQDIAAFTGYTEEAIYATIYELLRDGCQIVYEYPSRVWRFQTR